MSIEWFPTANSHTKVAYDSDWLVLDVGSGHNPHPRADVLVDKFLLDSPERLGRVAVLPSGKSFVVADACAMPFKDNAFDFVICSHIAEHIDNPDAFCPQLSRVGKRGYLETPSKFTEKLRPQPVHRWAVSVHKGLLIFEKNPYYQLGPTIWYQRFFYSLYFYNVSVQLKGKKVFAFSHGCHKPWHYVFAFTRRVLVRLWLLLKPLSYTRLLWENGFSWQVKQSPNSRAQR